MRLVTATGATVAEYTYDAWGAPLTSSGAMATINPLRYRGYYYDTESGFYYLQSRYYDPVTCRFVNSDAAERTDLAADSLEDANLFTYCANNPIARKDENGDLWVDLVVGAALSVATTWVAAKVTGQSYTWKDAAVAAAVGAMNTPSGRIWNAAAAVVSGVYTGITTYNQGASLGGSILSGMVSAALTVGFSGSLGKKTAGEPLKMGVTSVMTATFGTGAAVTTAVVSRVSIERGRKNGSGTRRGSTRTRSKAYRMGRWRTYNSRLRSSRSSRSSSRR